MASTATTNLSIVYSPPAGPANSVTASLATAAVHNAQSVGIIDIPSGTGPSAAFDIPFGSVEVAKMVVINNSSNDEVGIKLNGAVADNYRISGGGFMSIVMPTEPGADPVSSMELTWINSNTTLQTIQYFVFGD